MSDRRNASDPAGESYCLFETAIGPVGLAWNGRGLTRLQLPDKDRAATERRIGGGALPAKPPAAVKSAIAQIRRYLAGKEADFAGIAIDLPDTGPFHRKVYEAARKIGRGETASYGDLARAAGSPGAARAVGQAMAKNRIALIVPCHRVLGSGKRLGGFSAYGGTMTKEKLLAMEGIRLAPSGPAPAALDPAAAVRALCAADPLLARAIRAHGPCTLKPRPSVNPFQLLTHAIVSQQLSGKAADTIHGRLKAALDGTIAPRAVLGADVALLRSAGLSAAKAAAIRALAEATLDGTVPDARAIRRLGDDDIVERLTSVKGIGVWTAQMFLIFSLLRPDVMPSNDLGVRRGFARVFGKKDYPTPAEIEAHAERWRPYRSVASWYLWRAAD